MFSIGTILKGKTGKISDPPETRIDVVGVIVDGPFAKPDGSYLPNRFYKVSWADGVTTIYQETDLTRFFKLA